jgi:hypothetical protein
MTEPNIYPEQPALPAPSRFRSRQSAILGGIGLAVLVVGAAAGAGGTRLAQRWQPQSVMLLPPGSIGKMQDESPVAVKGSVAEIFGNKFIMQDDSGRALVDLGPRGDNAQAVAKGEAVTVQGRFDRGVVHAQVVVHADGRSEAFGPPKPPRPDRGPPDRLGPRADRGLDRGPPPPPPGADAGPPPPANLAPAPADGPPPVPPAR